MSNPSSKVILRSSPKRKRSRTNEPLGGGLPTPSGFTGIQCWFLRRKK